MRRKLSVGIERISFYVPRQYVELVELAEERGRNPEYPTNFFGQRLMAVPAPGEDVVTMSANAASSVLRGLDPTEIGWLMFATETAVDQAVAAGMYVHRLLGLSSRCRVIELKQACASSTSALELATSWVKTYPCQKVLVVASDIARYPLGTPAEFTQGAGAAAILVSSRPQVLALDQFVGVHAVQVDDFWRPNARLTAEVNGPLSLRSYFKSLRCCWEQYIQQSPWGADGLTGVCYHTPFTQMVRKAHHWVSGMDEKTTKLMEASLEFAEQIGNSYTASLFIALQSRWPTSRATSMLSVTALGCLHTAQVAHPLSTAAPCRSTGDKALCKTNRAGSTIGVESTLVLTRSGVRYATQSGATGPPLPAIKRVATV